MGYQRKIKYKDVIRVNGPCTVYIHAGRIIEIDAEKSTRIAILPKQHYDDHDRSRLTKRRRDR